MASMRGVQRIDYKEVSASDDEDYDGPQRDTTIRQRLTLKYGMHTPKSQQHPCLVRPHPCRYLPKKGTGDEEQEMSRAADKQASQMVISSIPKPSAPVPKSSYLLSAP
jgi:hypothetical protein